MSTATPIAECGFGGHDGQQALIGIGPTLHVEIGFDPAFAPGKPPALPDTTFPALVDTGATVSSIDNDLALWLRLPVVDRGEVSGVQGRFETNVYLAQIHVPDLDFTVYGRFAGVLLRQGGQPHFALLGRTFLRNFAMSYEGRTGSVILTRARG